MSSKRSIRILLFSLSIVAFTALAGSTVVTQAQCGRPSTKPTSTNTQSSGSGDANKTNTQSDMGNMDMSKMDMSNQNAGNMDMSACSCPLCKSGNCGGPGGSCSLKDHVKQRNSRTQARKKRR